MHGQNHIKSVKFFCVILFTSIPHVISGLAHLFLHTGDKDNILLGHLLV